MDKNSVNTFEDFMKWFKGKSFTGAQLGEILDAVLDRAHPELWQRYLGFESVRTHPESYGKTVQFNRAATDAETWVSSKANLDGLPPHIQQVSWILFKIFGIDPDLHKKKSWVSEINELWRASGKDMDNMRDGLYHAKTVVTEGKLIVRSPRSVIFGVQDYIQKKNITDNDLIQPKLLEA